MYTQYTPPCAVASCDVVVIICQDEYKAFILKHILSKEHLGIKIHKDRHFLYAIIQVYLWPNKSGCNFLKKSHSCQTKGFIYLGSKLINIVNHVYTLDFLTTWWLCEKVTAKEELPDGNRISHPFTSRLIPSCFSETPWCDLITLS